MIHLLVKNLLASSLPIASVLLLALGSGHSKKIKLRPIDNTQFKAVEFYPELRSDLSSCLMGYYLYDNALEEFANPRMQEGIFAFTTKTRQDDFLCFGQDLESGADVQSLPLKKGVRFELDNEASYVFGHSELISVDLYSRETDTLFLAGPDVQKLYGFITNPFGSSFCMQVQEDACGYTLVHDGVEVVDTLYIDEMGYTFPKVSNGSWKDEHTLVFQSIVYDSIKEQYAIGPYMVYDIRTGEATEVSYPEVSLGTPSIIRNGYMFYNRNGALSVFNLTTGSCVKLLSFDQGVGIIAFDVDELAENLIFIRKVTTEVHPCQIRTQTAPGLLNLTTMELVMIESD